MNDTLAHSEAELKLKANKPFVLLIAAQLVFNAGDWLHLLALLTMVGLKWEATPWEITALSLCMAVPVLLGGPLAGYASDRMNRKALMIGSDFVCAGLVACLVFAGSLWQVYILLLAKGMMDVSLRMFAGGGFLSYANNREHEFYRAKTASILNLICNF
jgi:MFS family permease